MLFTKKRLRQGLCGEFTLQINVLHINGCIVKDIDEPRCLLKLMQPFKQVHLDTTNVLAKIIFPSDPLFVAVVTERQDKPEEGQQVHGRHHCFPRPEELGGKDHQEDVVHVAHHHGAR